MVASLIRLKLQLLTNSFNRSAWQIIGIVFALIYGLIMVSLVFIVQAMLGSGSEFETLTTATALMGTVAVLAWVVFPLFVAGGDNLMDPKQFVTFAIPRNQLVTGLIVSGLLGVASVLTVVWLTGQAVMWRSEPNALLLAIITAPVMLLLCATVSQAMTTAVSAWFSSARVRNTAIITFMCLLLLSFPLLPTIGGLSSDWQEALAHAATLLGWTPFAAGFLLPADAAAGAWGAFAIRSLVTVATIVVALWVIRAGLVKITERPSTPRGQKTSAEPGKLGLLGIVPDRPWAAIAARALIYWFKDSRYGASIILVPVLVIMLIVLSIQSPVTGMLYVIGPALAWSLGIAICADISYDNTAFALHVTSGVSGKADRTGRVAALMTFGIPVILVGVAVPLTLLGNPDHLIMMLGLSLGLFFAFAGFSAFISARMTYPVPAPGENPFKTPEGAAGRMMLIQIGSLLLLVVISIPELIMLFIWLISDITWLGPALGLFSIFKGVAVLIGGVLLGARVFDRSQPELFQQVRDYA